MSRNQIGGDHTFPRRRTDVCNLNEQLLPNRSFGNGWSVAMVISDS